MKRQTHGESKLRELKCKIYSFLACARVFKEELNFENYVTCFYAETEIFSWNSTEPHVRKKNTDKKWDDLR